MAGEWREVTIGDLVWLHDQQITPASAPAELFYHYSIPAYDSGQRPALETGSAIGSNKFVVPRGAVLVSKLNPRLPRVWAPDIPDKARAVASTEFLVLSPRDGVDRRFLKYLMLSPAVRSAMEARVTGTSGSHQRVRPSDLLSISVEIPVDLQEQRAIAHILGTLDDRIELNRRMSETLEAMARALFKAWFVDFDPVRAKRRGDPGGRPRWQRGQSLPGLPAHLYDLFPDRLVDSELGEIPEGWGVGRLGQVLGELVSGARPKGGAAQEGVPSIGAENVIGLGRYDFSKEKYVPRDFFNELQRKSAAVRPGDVLLYKDGAQIGRKTYFDCGFPHEQCAVNEHVFIVRAKHAHYQRYLFFWLDQDWMTQEIISLNSNSAQPGINQQGVRALPLLKPPDAVVEAFDRLSKKLTDRLFAACHESRTLAALRDALLPKLIRGEIRVKDAERFLKERGL
jgi:type I restriction enzyme S subunit